jgi:hypothetical protein
MEKTIRQINTSNLSSSDDETPMMKRIREKKLTKAVSDENKYFISSNNRTINRNKPNQVNRGP